MDQQIGAGSADNVYGEDEQRYHGVGIGRAAEVQTAWLEAFLAGAPELDRAEMARLGHLLVYIQTGV